MTSYLASFEGIAGSLAQHLNEKPLEQLASAEADGGAAWHDLLVQVIAHKVLPSVLENCRESVNDWEDKPSEQLDAASIAAFVTLVLNDDVEQLRAVADRTILRAGGRTVLLNELLTPAARLLGRMWEEDTCDFMTVTLGVYRLNRIMQETEAAEVAVSHGFDRHILLLPAPGEQHGFGISMVADAFRADGWCVRSAPAVSRGQLLRLVKEEWFDAIGLSVSTERFLKGLPSCIRAVRAASCNPRSFVMLGGHAVICHPERSRFLGADGLGETAGKAVQLANNYMERTVTGNSCQFDTKPVDASLAR